MADDGEGVVLAWCKGCRHATASVPCGRCGGPACAGCGRCPPCDGPEITHQCPPEGQGLTPCCGKTPFELPRTDRMTLDPSLVTCRMRRDDERPGR